MARKTNYSEQIINMLKLENVEKRIREKMLYPAIIVGGISKDSKETVEFKCPHCGHIWSETFINKYSRYNRALTCPSCKAKLAEGRKVDVENEISTNLEFLDGIALKNYHRIFVIEAADMNDSKGLAIARIDIRSVFRVEDTIKSAEIKFSRVYYGFISEDYKYLFPFIIEIGNGWAEPFITKNGGTMVKEGTTRIVDSVQVFIQDKHLFPLLRRVQLFLETMTAQAMQRYYEKSQ